MPKLSPAVRAVLVQERQAHILKAAGKVFAAKGYERATVSDIAKEARVAQGTIYNYFDSKGDILIALLRDFLQAPMSALATTRLDTPEASLTFIARNIVLVSRQVAPTLRILLTSMSSMPKKVRQKYFEQVVLYATGILAAFFQEEIDAGVLRADVRPQTLAFAFVGMFFPTLLLEQVLQVRVADGPNDEEFISARVRVFLNGALAVPTPPAPERG